MLDTAMRLALIPPRHTTERTTGIQRKIMARVYRSNQGERSTTDGMNSERRWVFEEDECCDASVIDAHKTCHPTGQRNA
jgi:hypothetical protein